MRKEITVTAELRDSRGKNEARRLRAKGSVPAVLYGGAHGAVPVAVNPKELTRILHSKTGHNTIFNLSFSGRAASQGNGQTEGQAGTEGEDTPVMIVDWQFDPIKSSLLHADLKRIDLEKRITVKVPIVAEGDPRGVKLQGGVHEIVTRELEIECLPNDIPEQFTVQVSELMIGQSIRAADIPMVGSMKLLTLPDAVISHVVSPRAEEVAAAEPAAEVVAAAPEPEVIKKGKKEDAAAEPAPPAKKK